mgnify:CR=1 FL=1
MKTNSLIVPIYRNEENIPSLLAALEDLNCQLNGDLEVVFTIDGSPDNSGALLAMSEKNFTCRIVFHSRNFGSFVAIRTGMEHATGRYMAAMAADLQEPPELILEFFRLLATGEVDVVFGQRTARADPFFKKLFSNVFWGAYRRFVLPSMPRGGVDIFGCTRQVAETILDIEESNGSLVAQMFWVGFRRRFVPYERREREHGKSAWNFSRRFRYMMNSIFSFTDMPILAVLWIGLAGCAVSTLFGLYTLIAWSMGYVTERGYTTIIIFISFFSSITLVVQGILGLYLWQAVENSKRRPLRVVSQVIEHEKAE